VLKRNSFGYRFERRSVNTENLRFYRYRLVGTCRTNGGTRTIGMSWSRVNSLQRGGNRPQRGDSDDISVKHCAVMPDRLPDTSAVAHGIVGQLDPRPTTHDMTPKSTLKTRVGKDRFWRFSVFISSIAHSARRTSKNKG
jgi:hypothetical protein